MVGVAHGSGARPGVAVTDHQVDAQGMVAIMLMGRGKVEVHPNGAERSEYHAGRDHYVVLSRQLALPVRVVIPAERTGDEWDFCRRSKLTVSLGLVTWHDPKVLVVTGYDDEDVTVLITEEELTVTRQVAR